MKLAALLAFMALVFSFLSCKSVILTDQKEQIEKLKKSRDIIAESASTIGESLAKIEAVTDDQQVLEFVQIAQAANEKTKKEVDEQLITIDNVKKNSEIKDNEIKTLKKKIGRIKFWGFIGAFIFAAVAFAAGFILKKFI